MKIIVKAKDFKHAAARMQVAGLLYRPKDDYGKDMQREYQLEKTVTHDLVCTDGHVVFCVDIRPEFVDKIPSNDSPNFTVEWQEDDLIDDGEGNMVQKPKPNFGVDVFVDGIKTGTKQGLCGAIV